MRTPAGQECPHYFEDFHRGRQVQECRLIEATPGGGNWAPDLCSKCPVPGIARANACPNLVLEAQVRSGFLGLVGRRVEVRASCLYTAGPVDEPHIGCGHCHEAFDLPPVIESI